MKSPERRILGQLSMETGDMQNCLIGKRVQTGYISKKHGSLPKRACMESGDLVIGKSVLKAYRRAGDLRDDQCFI